MFEQNPSFDSLRLAAESFNRQGSICYKMGYLEEAADVLQEYVKKDPLQTGYPMLGQCYYFLGKLNYNQLGDHKKARYDLHCAVEIFENLLQEKAELDLYEYLGLSCYLLGLMGDRKMEKKAMELADIIEKMSASTF